MSRSPVMISLALSLALASSGFCNLLPFGNLVELEAEVGIDPENSISDREIAEFACQSTAIPHYPATILPLSFHSILLAILLAIPGTGPSH